jgi:hypothetical protein
MERTGLQIELGKRLTNVRGEPKQAFIKSGEQRIGSFLLWGDNPGTIKLNAAGKFFIHELITDGGEK